MLWLPKEPVGRWAPVGDVIEEDLQLIVIVKVCNDNSANGGWHRKLLGCYVLKEEKANTWYKYTVNDILIKLFFTV